MLTTVMLTIWIMIKTMLGALITLLLMSIFAITIAVIIDKLFFKDNNT